MDKLEKAARSIVEEGRDLYEVSIEERIEPVYLRHMVAVLTGDSSQDEQMVRSLSRFYLKDINQDRIILEKWIKLHKH